jgi:hypothetical protein
LKWQKIRDAHLCKALSLDWPEGFYCFNDDKVTLYNTRFVGASLWVDAQINFPTQSDPPYRLYESLEMLNHSRAIYLQSGKRFAPEIMLDLHRMNAA